MLTPDRHRKRLSAKRLFLTILGILLIALSPVVGAIPGPGGVFVFAGGLVLLLQNSRWARRKYVRLERRFPKFGRYANMALRRPSAKRRREREKAQAATG